MSVALNEGLIDVASLHHDSLNHAIGYVSSKVVAECLCATAAKKFGVPVVIHRVGMVGPSTATGAAQRDNFVTRIFAAAVSMRSVPNDVEHRTALVLNPVDRVAAAMSLLLSHGHRSAVDGRLVCAHFSNADQGVAMATVWGSLFPQALHAADAAAGVPAPIPYVAWAAAARATTALLPLSHSVNDRRMNNFDSGVGDAKTRMALHRWERGASRKHSGIATLPPRDIAVPEYWNRYVAFLSTMAQTWYA